MHYKIRYECLSHIGNVRKMNQDNFVCSGQYMAPGGAPLSFLPGGMKDSKDNAVFGIFDGMGGQECGEMAAWIAAKHASEIQPGKYPGEELFHFCHKANREICAYAEEQGVMAMGTTAALLVFTPKGITLCNLGDSKIYRLRKGSLDQLSEDHVANFSYGRKAPLTQNLGIPPEILTIEPYLAQGNCYYGDQYLLCSDGLTDMVSAEEIREILCTSKPKEAMKLLLDKALARGGRDNITIILCEIRRPSGGLFDRLCRRKRREV
ncbi:MAG: serine/threonine-protein phosphatase [Oscillospiraceae bacterium]|nr:serine/threonine-protein phosphatase [Oscillospiraceae bacterium]